MSKELSYPEFRQSHRDVSLDDNCRLSGHNNVPTGGNQSLLRRSERKFTIKTNSISNKQGVISRWVVISNGKRPVLIRYLFLKWIYDSLTREEWETFLSFNEVTRNIQIYFALKARNKKIKMRTIRKILESNLIPNVEPISRKEYQGLKRISFTRKRETNPPTEKPKPYTGYAKGYKDGKSSKRSFRVEEFGSSPVETSPIFEDEITFLVDIARDLERNPRLKVILFTNSESQDESD